jgi:MFS family permease
MPDASSPAPRLGAAAPSVVQPQPCRPSSNAAIALGFLIGFTSMAHRTGFGVLYPAMVADRGWTASEVTAAFSLAMLIYSPAAVLTGQMLDRIGVRATMLLGTTMLSVGLCLVALVTELWQLYLLYGVAVGVGSSPVGFLAMLKLLSLRAGSRFGLAVGLFNVGQGVGSLVSVQALVEREGWRPGFVALGIAAVVMLLPLTLVAAPDRSASRGAAAESQVAGMRGLWRLPAFWITMVSNATMGYLMLLPAHQVAHLMLVGLPDGLSAAAGGLFGACIGLGALAGGWMMDRQGPGRLGMIGAGLLCLGLVGLIFGGPGPVLGLVAVYVLAGGIGRGFLGVHVTAFQARTFAGPALGRVTGLLDLGFGFGAFAGPYIVALSRDVTGSYGPGLATALIVSILAGLCPILAGATLRSNGVRR